MDLASKLSTRVQIERKMVTFDPQYGSEAVTWEAFAWLWAEVKDVLPSRAERMAEHIQIARRPARIRIRYLAGITPDMRLNINGRIYQIIAGPSVIGRREAIELMVEELSSEGASP